MSYIKVGLMINSSDRQIHTLVINTHSLSFFLHKAITQQKLKEF